MSDPRRPDAPGDPWRARWGATRLLLMGVDAVGLFVALVLARSWPTAAVAVATLAATAILAAAGWDLLLLRRRWRRVLAGVQQLRVIDPLDSWMHVAALAALTVIPASVGGAPTALRVLAVALAVSAVAISWGGARRYGWRPLQAALRARVESPDQRRSRP